METQEEIEKKLESIRFLLNSDDEGIYIPYIKRSELHIKADMLAWVLGLVEKQNIEVHNRQLPKPNSIPNQIILFLRKHPNKTKREIATALNLNIGSIINALNKLVFRKEIISETANLNDKIKMYRLANKNER